MRRDIEIAGLKNGLFIYSLWSGYRESDYQQAFEGSLKQAGFENYELNTSGHATVPDIARVMTELDPKMIIPIHSMEPYLFIGLSDRVSLMEDGVSFKI